MHASSFYDLRACYIYTPLYGPYSLSEALEGLLSYSLDESQDSIAIGSKRTLHHELISELSNVADDLQDYLIYFSSNFPIFPSDSLDFFKELRAGCDGFEPLIVYWGAIITRLAIARGIVERNFWPHLFQPTVDNLADLQRLGRRLPFALPKEPLNKSSAFASTFFSSLQTHITPHATSSLLDSQRLLPNTQSERPRTMPSDADPTGGKEGRSSSLRLDATPTPSGLYPGTRIPSISQLSNIALESRFPKAYEDRSDKLVAPSNHTVAAQRSSSSISTHVSETRESRNPENNAKVVGDAGQDCKGIEAAAEGDEVPVVPCVRPYPTRLTSVQAEATGECATEPSRTSSPSTALWPSSPAPYISNATSELHCGPTISPQPTISLPHPSVNAIREPSTRLFAKGRPVHHSLSSIPLHSHSTAPKRRRRSKAQSRRFGPSHVGHRTTPHFRQQPLDVHATYPSSETFQLCQEDHWISKKPPSSIDVDIPSDTSASVHGIPSISPPPTHDLYHSASELRSHPLSLNRRCSSMPPTLRQFDNCCGQQLSSSQASVGEENRSPSSYTAQLAPSRTLISPSSSLVSCQRQHDTQNEHPRISQSQTYPMAGKDSRASFSRFNTTPTLSGSRPICPFDLYFPRSYDNSSNEVFAPPNRTIAARRFQSSTPAHTSETRGPRDARDNAKASEIDEQVTRETKVVEGEEVTRVPCTHLLPIQLIPVRGNADRKLIVVPARVLSPPTAMRSMPTAPPIAHPTSDLGSTILFPCSRANASSRRPSRLSSKRRHTQESAWTATPFCSLSINQKQQLETQTRRVAPSPVSPPTSPSFQQSWPNSYPSLDTSQTCRDGRLWPKEPPSSISVSSASDTSSSLRHVPLPHSSRNLYRYPASFHSCPSPSSPKRRSSSLPPTFRQDEQVPTNASSFLDVPMVDNKGCPSSTMCDSNPTSVPTTPTSPSSILWGLEPAEGSAASPATLDNASDPSSPIHNGRPVSCVTHFHNVYRYPTPSPSLKAYQPGPDTRDDRSETLRSPAASTVETEDCMSPLMPNAHMPSLSSKACRLSPGTLNEQLQTEAFSLPEIPPVDSKRRLSSTTPYSNSTSFPTTPTSLLSILWGPEPAEASAALPTKNQSTSMKLDTLSLDNDDATIHSPNSVLLHDSELQPKCSAKPTMPAILETESEPKATQRLGVEEVFEKSPMAQLIQAIESQLGPTERSFMLVSSLEELTLDLIVDRGEVRARNLPRYHLEKAMMNNLTTVVTAQQIFLQQAAALIMDRKFYFIVDPGDTLIPILQGTSSLPQLYTVWRALITRIKLGVKAGEKYMAEYQLQVDAAALSSLSTLHC